ncbi:MAG: LamG domain-containing protein [Phycisphaerae bacterium]|nr:LamG domain-containing protein [Phycisphaerae bacterium]
MKRVNSIAGAIMLGLAMATTGLADLSDGLVAYYPFNGNANDEGSNGNDGLVLGATLTQDMFGNADSAYYFDGVDDYIRASANNLPTPARTVSLWFYTDAVGIAPYDPGYRPNLVGYGGGAGCGTSWLMGINHWGHASMGMTGHCWANTIEYYYGSEAPAGSWFHFVITTDPTGTRIYLDSELKASNSIYVNNTYVNGRHLAIGVAVNPTGYAPYKDYNVGYFKGTIDEVRIYDRALSLAEIQELYALEAVPVPSAVLLGLLGLSVTGVKLRKRA